MQHPSAIVCKVCALK